MQSNHDWLTADEQLGWKIGGVEVDPATRTRNVEYQWVLDNIDPSAKCVLDAAAGYVPTWHELPRMLAARGYNILAVDHDMRSLQMPYVDGVVRGLADITSLPYADKQFDVVLCISTLEHLTAGAAMEAAKEMKRLARKQILVTADVGYWLPALFGVDGWGPQQPTSPSLNPPVYAMRIDL